LESTEKRTGEFLQANTGLWFCDGCLALKVGDSLQAMQDVMTALTRYRGYRVSEHRCATCRRLKAVIRAVADTPRRR
jgi:ribosomal protein L37AE/L43A